MTLDHLLGRGGERIDDRLGGAGGHEGAGPTVETRRPTLGEEPRHYEYADHRERERNLERGA